MMNQTHNHVGTTNSNRQVPTVSVRQHADGLAIASMVVALAGYVTVIVVPFTSLLSVIFGHVALRRIREGQGAKTGKGMAITGLVLGYIVLACIPVYLVFWFANTVASPDAHTSARNTTTAKAPTIAVRPSLTKTQVDAMLALRDALNQTALDEIALTNFDSTTSSTVIADKARAALPKVYADLDKVALIAGLPPSVAAPRDAFVATDRERMHTFESCVNNPQTACPDTAHIDALDATTKANHQAIIDAIEAAVTTTAPVVAPAPVATTAPIATTAPFATIRNRDCPDDTWDAWLKCDTTGHGIQPSSGSWVAFSPALHVRFSAPPSLVEDPEYTGKDRYALRSRSNVYDFEALAIYRFAGNRGGESASTWTHESEAFAGAANISGFTVTSGPRQQQVSGYQGNVGQFHYRQFDSGLPVSGTMWVGEVGGDELVIVYRCAPERERQLDDEFAQVIRTIDFSAH
jgi:hypothetical protein